MQKCLLQKSPPPSIRPSLPILFPYLFFTSPYPSGCYCCSWVMSIIVVQITRRNTYTIQSEREDEQKKEGCCCCCLFQCIDSATHTHTSQAMHVHFTLCLFLSLCFVVIYALSLLVGIHRQRVMTSKERGEDVYECMLDQTLNDERSQKSNPINCTKRKKITEMDGTVMAFFIS